MYLKIPQLSSIIRDKEYQAQISCSATNQILNIINTYDLKSITLPAFLCNEILQAINFSGIKVNYYRLNKEFDPILDSNLISSDCLYLCDYFGYPIKKNKFIESFFNTSKPIIIDRAHSFLAGNNSVDCELTKRINVYMIFSLRKFIPTSNGSLIIYKKGSKEINIYNLIEGDNNYKRDYILKPLKFFLNMTNIGRIFLSKILINKIKLSNKNYLNGYRVTLPNISLKNFKLAYSIKDIDKKNYKILNPGYIKSIENKRKKEISEIEKNLIEIINPLKFKKINHHFSYGIPYGIPVLLNKKVQKKELEDELVIPFLKINNNVDVFLWPFNTNSKYYINNIGLKSLILFVPKVKYFI